MALSMARHLTKSSANAYNPHKDVSLPFRRLHGSLKWTDWSVLQDIPFYYKGVRATSLDLLYRDGWTVTAGVGHKFNDQWSGALQVS